MSDFLDKAKDLAKDLTDKAKDAVTEHSDKIDDGIDKAAEFVDDKTKGKYSDKIGSVQAKAHDVVDRHHHRQGAAASAAGRTPPADGHATRAFEHAASDVRRRASLELGPRCVGLPGADEPASDRCRPRPGARSRRR